ncbi:MAG: c-type cytochrome [Ignavibacteriales bacterium]|nr:c-type cytochrome [Ignavibacteriales bacterium]
MKLMIGALAALVLALCVTTTSTAAEKKDGKAIFENAKCAMCHSVDAAGITSKKAKPADLSIVGATKKADWFAKYLKKEVDLNGKKHPAVFKGTDEETVVLTKWLETLKKAK